MTATNSGPAPERDNASPASATQPEAAAAPAPTDLPPAVVIEQPVRGTLIDRIPVTKVSPVIEGGAYPAKAVVGESIPIRATVFREGHDAVNASVVGFMMRV